MIFRARPAMGTFLTIHVRGSDDTNAVSAAFELAAALEKLLSKFDPESDVSRFNRGERGSFSAEFEELLSFAFSLERSSAGAFRPFCAGQLDLSGVAKGFIVDRISDFLRARLPEASGSVNAGGDVRFFNSSDKELAIRVTADLGLRVKIERDALATSGFSEALDNPLSSTKYNLPPARGLNFSHTVSVEASSCAVADALTKVGWFAPASVVADCARVFSARVIVLTDRGDLVESFQAS